MQPSSTPKPPSPIETSWREDRAVAVALIEAAQIEALLLRRGLLLRQYNPGQPRVPAGNATGGQWTSGAGGGGGGGGFGLGLGEGGLAEFAPEGGAGIDIGEASDWSIRDENHASDGALIDQTAADLRGNTIQSEFRAAHEAGAWDERHTVTTPDGNAVTFETEGRTQAIRDGGPDGEIVSRTVWTPGGPERDATVQQVLLGPLLRSTVAGATALFGWLSTLNGGGGDQTVMSFDARNFIVDGDSAPSLIFAGKLTNDEFKRACPRFGEVEARLAEAIERAGGRELYPTDGQYGTAVHKNLAYLIRALNDSNFVAEKSVLKSHIEGDGEAYYGQVGSIRFDIVENVDGLTICGYDIKTGKAIVTAARAIELVTGMKRLYPSALRFIIAQVKPRS